MARVLGGAGDEATRIENRVGNRRPIRCSHFASQIVSGRGGIGRQTCPGKCADCPYAVPADTLPGSLSLALDALEREAFRVGQIVDQLDESGVGDNTLLIFCSDNGPEFRPPHRGTAGPWSGTYHTAMEGSLRVPFIARWPGKVPVDVNNQIVHVVDLLPTLAELIEGVMPDDGRPIDCVSQLDFLLGKTSRSNREGFLFYIKDELRAVKWRDWKLHFVWEPYVNAGKKTRIAIPVPFDSRSEGGVRYLGTQYMGPWPNPENGPNV